MCDYNSSDCKFVAAPASSIVPRQIDPNQRAYSVHHIYAHIYALAD